MSDCSDDDVERACKLAHVPHASWVLEQAFREVRRAEAALWRAEVDAARRAAHEANLEADRIAEENSRLCDELYELRNARKAG